MNRPATPGRAERVERLVIELGAAFQQRAVYAREHPQVDRALARTLAAFTTWCVEGAESEASLVLLDEQLLVNRQAIPEDSPWARGLLQAFKRYEIRGMTLLAGLDAAELGAFLDGCATPAGARATAHIALGQAGFAAGDAAESSAVAGARARVAPAWLSGEEMAAARAEMVAAAAGAASRLERLRALVARLARSAESAALDPLRLEIATPDDRAFVHGLAVALGTLRLGRALGLRGDSLDDLALAGFLHDIGYLEPVEPGESADERRLRHPVRGASRLATLEELPDVAVVVAGEHHLRFDGTPNYPRLAEPRPPVAAARLVAVVDTWETLRSRGNLEEAEALALLRRRAGTFLDPALVELFAGLLAPAGA